MALPNALQGDSTSFHLYYGITNVSTIGNREQLVWSSIKHLCAKGVSDPILHDIYGITSQKLRSKVAKNIKLYINQAFDFYSAATNADANTSPLLYYYCFLNLAKALCEIKHPQFHLSQECYSHGISWRPNRQYLVDVTKDSVFLSKRGVWHVLWEIFTGLTCNVSNPTNLKIKDLLACCPEINIEYERIFDKNSNLLDLYQPDILYNKSSNKLWIKLSVSREGLRYFRLSRHRFIDLISNGHNWYIQVKSSQNDYYTFELSTPKELPLDWNPEYHQLFEPEIKAMNPFVHYGTDDLDYFIPIQTNIPLHLPQSLIIYTLIFWLGSLVRYDPHSIAYLQDSQFWLIIDGLLTQSRLCLLELFEWDFYQVSTHLKCV